MPPREPVQELALCGNFVVTIDWNAFTPGSALAGGAVIGLAAALLLLANGHIVGISGIVGRLLLPRAAGFGWRLAFVAGLLAAPAAYALVTLAPAPTIEAGYARLVVAGLLVGIGTRYASGCTSGHGICGLAQLSPRSLAATACFMGAGVVTVFVVRHVLA